MSAGIRNGDAQFGVREGKIVIVVSPGLVTIHGGTAHIIALDNRILGWQKILLDFFGKFEGVHQLETMPETVDHVIGMFSNYTELILGGHRNLAGQIPLSDFFQNDRLIVK